MSEGPFPDKFSDAARWLLGSTFVFVAGFEGYVMLWDGRSVAGAASIIIAIGLTAVLARWKQLEAWAGTQFQERTRRTVTDPRVWVGSILGVLLIISLSPFVEQQRWPFAPISPNNEIIDLQNQLKEAHQENDKLKKVNDLLQKEIDVIEKGLKDLQEVFDKWSKSLR